MNLLLDTHIALWVITDDARLSQKARDLLLAPKNIVWISAVTIWEIAIKFGLGRSSMPISGAEALSYFQESGFHLLAIEPEHAAAVESLPTHHQDPFDRLLVAQALVEPMRLITHDSMVALYSDTVILV